MAERTTVVYPNPQILAEAVAARTLLTITDLLSEPNRTRVDIAVTGGTDGRSSVRRHEREPIERCRGLEPRARMVGRRTIRGRR